MTDLPALPPEALAALAALEARTDVFTEEDVSTALLAAVDKRVFSEEEVASFRAELVAFGLIPTERGVSEPWRTYFGPRGWGTTSDGRRTYWPDLAVLHAGALSHWIRRSGESAHPVLVARYADLAWDLAKTLKQPQPSIQIAQRAMDAYLAVVAKGHIAEPLLRHRALVRALQLAIRLRDDVRRDQARAALLAEQAIAMECIRRGEYGAWQPVFRTLTVNKGAGLTEVERAALLAEVEEVLRIRRDGSDPKRYHPHDAQDAAEALMRYHRTRTAPDQVKASQGALGEVLEDFAARGDAALAASVLPDAAEAYRAAGRLEDAKRVQRLIQDKVRESALSMGLISTRLPMSREALESKLEAFAEEACADGPEAALANVAKAFASKRAEIKANLIHAAKGSPLQAMLTKTIHAEDHIAGTVASLAEDENGAILFQASRDFDFSGIWLDAALRGAVRRFDLDVADLVREINATGLFGKDTLLLERGLRAWLMEDHIEAAHLLFPQVERAVRQMVDRLGQPVTKPHRELVGVSQSISFGDALRVPEFVKAHGEDLCLHLAALYTDPRGWNLRNRIAHGLMHGGHFHAGHTQWMVQTLLLLARPTVASGG